MAEEIDEIAEAFEGQLRVAVTAGGQIGEQIARLREAALHRAQAASDQEARELTSRLAAEQRAARVELANVYRADWWERATPEQIGRTYQVARAWSQEDPEAARAEARMRDELRTRYGVDVDQANADPAAVRSAVENAGHYRDEAEAERALAAAENAEAVRLMQQADREDALAYEARGDEAREDGRALYDSAERRSATASDLEAKGIDHEVVATRMRADVSQAKPATEAVAAGAGAKSPKARKARGRGATVQRAGLDR